MKSTDGRKRMTGQPRPTEGSTAEKVIAFYKCRSNRRRAAIVDALPPSEEGRFWELAKCREVLQRFSVHVSLAHSAYLVHACMLAELIRAMEDFSREEATLNLIRAALCERSGESAAAVFDGIVSTVQLRWDAEAAVDGGRVSIACPELRGSFDDIVECGLREICEELKAGVMAVEEYARSLGAEEVIPAGLAETIRQSKCDYTTEMRPDLEEYGTAHIRAMEDRGETPTAAERGRAVFPSYDDITPPDDVLEVWRAKLKECADEMNMMWGYGG